MYEYTYLCIEFVITHNFQTMIPKHVLYLLIICISCTLATCSSSPDEGVKAKLAQEERSIKAMEIGLDRIKRKSLYSSRFAMFCHIYQNARRGSIMQGFRYQVITCSDVA